MHRLTPPHPHSYFTIDRPQSNLQPQRQKLQKSSIQCMEGHSRNKKCLQLGSQSIPDPFGTNNSKHLLKSRSKFADGSQHRDRSLILKEENRQLVYDSLKVVLKKYQDLKTSSNQYLKEIVLQQLVQELKNGHELFRKIDIFLLEALILMGQIQIYSQNEHVSHCDQNIYFILYGKIKLFNRDFKFTSEKSLIFGSQQALFEQSIPLKARALEQCCTLMIPLQSYQFLHLSSIKSNFKTEFMVLQSLIKRSFLQKHILSHLKGKLQ